MSESNDREKRKVTVQEMLNELTFLFDELDVPKVEENKDLNAYMVLELVSVNKPSKKQIDKVSSFLDYLKDTEFPGNVIQYSLITQRIFERHRTDSVESLSEKIRVIAEDFLNEKLREDQELSRRFYKLIDHLQLASFQLNEILEQTKEKQDALLKRLEEANETIQKSEDELNILKEESRREISRLYVQFVTILGIFTAIVVSVFGGLSILSGIFEQIDSTAAWKLILMGSAVSIFVLCALFLLTRWVSIIVFKVFGYGEERNLLENVLSNGGFAVGIFIFGYLMVAAVVLRSQDATNELTKILNVGGSVPILVLLGIPIAIGFAVLVKAIDMRRSNH